MQTDLDATSVIAAAAMWVVTVARVGMVRVRDTRPTWFAIAFLAAAETLEIGPIYGRVDAAVGVVGSAAVLRHSLALVSAASVVLAATEAFSVPGSAVRRRDTRITLIGLAAALMVMISPWLIAPPRHLAPSLLTRSEYFADSWQSTLHWLAFLAYLGWALARTSVACWQYRQAEREPAPRLAISLVGIGSTVCLAYPLEKLFAVLAWVTGHGPASVRPDLFVELALLAVGIPLIAAGAAWEPLAGQMARMSHRQDCRRAHRALAGFAERVRAEFPQIGTALALDSEERVIADIAIVQEGLRQLTAYVPRPEHQRFVREEEWLAQALAAKAAARPVRHMVTAPPVTDTGQTIDTAWALSRLYTQAKTIPADLDALIPASAGLERGHHG